MPAVDIWSIAVTLIVLALTVVFFTLGKFRSDMVAVCALLALMLFGVLTPQEALSGFSNSIIITIAGVFIIGGAIVRSGLANAISGKILKLAGDNQHLLFMLIMLITAAIGSLVSNTGTVAIMMPVVVSLSMAINVSPSRFLMPLAFMSAIGGMLTLIGNPGNMVVNDVYVKAGFPTLTLFSFLPVGIVSMVFGLFVLAPVTSFFLARRKNEKGERKDKGATLKDLADKYQLSQNTYEITVPEQSPMAGQNLISLNLTGKYGVIIQEILRKRNSRPFGSPRAQQIVPGPHTVIQAGDVLHVVTSLKSAMAMADAYRLKLRSPDDPQCAGGRYRFDAIGICELVLMSSSRLVNRTVAETNLREQFGVSLLGIQRGDQYILENVKDQTIQSGDALLVQGTWENLARLDEYSKHWVVVGRPQEQLGSASRREKIPLVAIVILLMIFSMALNLLPTVVSVMLAAMVLIAGGCFRNVEEAYSAINWDTLVMIACMLPMAIAMEKSGLIGIVSTRMTALGAAYGPHVALALVYGVTSLLNIFISATPVALLVAPVAIQIALDLNFSALPFIFAVATASCMCFASPFSTPSNALVMSAGRYTFFDYVKIGLPLQILMGIVMVPVLPLLFPF